MNRVILMPHVANPFCLRFWLRNRETYRSVVGATVVAVGGFFPKALVPELLSPLIMQDQTRFSYFNYPLLHGSALETCLPLVENDNTVVCLMEEDCFIRDPAELDRMFGLIESGEFEAIISPRGSAGPAVLKACEDAFGLQNAGGWPCCFFARKSTLVNKYTTFNPKSWRKGEAIPVLGVEAISEDGSTDTFGEFAWQLRRDGRKTLENPDFKFNPCEVMSTGDHVGGWFTHIGSLSGALTEGIRNKHGVALANTDRATSGQPTDQEFLPGHHPGEIAKRLAAWKMQFDHSDHTGLDSFAIEYKEGLDRLTEGCSLEDGLVDSMYDKLLEIIPIK